jgi:putative OmpL-like beta-barrel porin-2
LERHRSAALGILLALSSTTTIATAQSTESSTTNSAAAAKPAPDSAAKAASDSAAIANAIPAFFRDIQANAFVSFGDTYNLNSPPDQLNGLRFFDSRSNSMGLDGAELVVQKPVAKAGDAGFRIDLVAGTALPKAQAAGLNLGTSGDLQQAFFSYIAPAGTGLRLDIGKFVTSMGYELIEGYDGYNTNYSRSLLFNYAIPLTHTGVKASYSFSPKVSLMGIIANGWDNAVDNNASKSFGGMLTILPVAPVALYFNYMGGPEKTDTNGFVRHVGDFVATVKVSDALQLAFNADYGFEQHASLVKPGDDAVWSGVAGYATITPAASPFSLGLRIETFKDDGGTRLGFGKARANEFTITPAFKFGKNFVVRPEARYDWVDQAIFADDNGPNKKSQGTIGINAIFVY